MRWVLHHLALPDCGKFATSFVPHHTSHNMKWTDSYIFLGSFSELQHEGQSVRYDLLRVIRSPTVSKVCRLKVKYIL